jgi:hypothetical protein
MLDPSVVLALFCFILFGAIIVAGFSVLGLFVLHGANEVLDGVGSLWSVIIPTSQFQAWKG